MERREKSKKYDIFLLDADDTLFDFAACSKNALRKAMRDCGIIYATGDHRKYNEVNDRMWKAIERREIAHEEIFERRFTEFLTYKGESPSRWRELNEAYVFALSGECVTIPGAELFLKELKALGRIYVITNGTATVQRRRFEKFGMSRFAEGIFISEEIGAYKPAKAFMENAAKGIPDYSPSRAVVIGDSVTSDVALAANCGLDCIWFNPAGGAFTGATPPTYEARGYEGIIKAIKGDKI